MQTSSLSWSPGFVIPPQGIGGLGDARPITAAIGSGLLSAGGVIAAIPGGQLPGAIVAAVGALTNLVGGFFKPDLTKVEASRIVDQIEAQTMKPLRAGWQSLSPAEKTVTNQAAFLEAFDAGWRAVVKGCSNPALQQAGVNCTADRGPGSCHWDMQGHTPGHPPNDCGSWWTWYRDPIANDPDVHPDVQTVTGGGGTVDAGAGSGDSSSPAGGAPVQTPNTAWLFAGIGVLGLVAAFAMGGD